MSIYTRSGDHGRTRLLDGAAVSKDDLRVKAYGAVDEFQAAIGLSRSLCDHAGIDAALQAVQTDLFTASSELAANEPDGRLGRVLTTADVAQLEAAIDDWVRTHGLPQGFVVPGRDPASAAVHLARTVCRRCERILVALQRQRRLRAELLTYFNRLGDLLFVLAWVLEVRDVARQAVREVLEAHEGVRS